MIKIRLHGEEKEIKKVLNKLRDVLDIIVESNYYPDRGTSRYSRVYLDVNILEKNKLSKLIDTLEEYKNDIDSLVRIANFNYALAKTQGNKEKAQFFYNEFSTLSSFTEGLQKILESI